MENKNINHNDSDINDVESLRKVFSAEPDNIEVALKLAQIYADKGWFNEAIEIYKRIIKKDENNYSLLLDYGNLLYKKNDYKEAQKIFKKLTQIKPQRVEGWNNLGIIFLEFKDINGAIEAFKKVLSIEPDNAGALLNLGNCFEKIGQLEKAFDFLNKAINVKPDFADAWYNLGNIYLQQNKVDDAINAFLKAIRLQREFPSALKNLGFAYEQKGDFDKAFECYKNASDLAKADSGLYVNMGNIYIKKKKYEEARQCYLHAVRLSPKEMPGWMGLRNLAFLKGDIESYIKATNAILSKLDEVTIAETIMVLRELSHYKEAEELIKKTQILEKKGEEIDAEKLCFPSVVKNNQESLKEIYNNLKKIKNPSDHILLCCAHYALDNGLYDDAVEFVTKMTKKNIFSLKILWQSLIRKNQIDEAEKKIISYLEKHPDCFEAYFYLAKINAQKGDKEKAKQYLLKALENGFTDLEIINSDPLLQDILLSIKLEP
jgi:tetratricopeptide (TPR) repeat protein